MRRYCCPRTYFYPRPPRGGRLNPSYVAMAAGNFYPRPPRGGRRREAKRRKTFLIFLSTPSARRATVPASRCFSAALTNFYPRPPRGGRHSVAGQDRHPLVISIHALREEGDGCSPHGGPYPYYFYPRPPRGGRRGVSALEVAGVCISIHALREEGDSVRADSCPRCRDFYPRPPRGGRRRSTSSPRGTSRFLSTPSARRATACQTQEERRR